MRLKHSLGPLAAVESRLNFRNAASEDSNSNEPNFNPSAILWDPSEVRFTKKTTGGTLGPGPDPDVLDNDRRRQRLVGHAANIGPRTAGSRVRDAALADPRRYPDEVSDDVDPSSSASSPSSTPASSSQASSASSSPLGSPIQGGIVNPNYPGFEHLAAKLLKLAAGSDCEDDGDDDDEEINNNNNNNNCNFTSNLNNINNNNTKIADEDDGKIDPVNRDRRDREDGKQALYKPKLAAAMTDAFLSSAKEDLGVSRDFAKQARTAPVPRMLAPASRPAARRFKDSNRAIEDMVEEEEKFNKESTEKELAGCIVPRKKEKMALNQQVRKAQDRAEKRHPALHPAAAARREKRSSFEVLGGFDVFNIETAMPRIDLDLIESHLRAAKEEERQRRNDREEIRRRLAMGSEDADYYTSDQRPGKKPSLQARLQSGMNLQICFMNETLSDTESPGSEGDIPSSGASALVSSKALTPKTEASSERLLGAAIPSKPVRPLSLPLRLDSDREWREHSSLMTEADFLARQAQLQTEARMALAQAKDMAHMQMELERQKQNASPITEMVRHTLKKVGVSFPEDRRRLSRQILTEMNVAQLQVIVNDLHTQIEYLNESLVRFLMERDDLHMEQDSMLVDIEDLTRYLGAKEQSSRGGGNQNNNLLKSNGTSGVPRMNCKK